MCMCMLDDSHRMTNPCLDQHRSFEMTVNICCVLDGELLLHRLSAVEWAFTLPQVAGAHSELSSVN